MAIKNKLLIGFLLWVLFGHSNAIAQSHKHTKHHHNQIVSPFDSKQEARSLHCLLRGHADRLDCPHSKADGAQSKSIAKECDGKSSGSNTRTITFGSEFAETNFIMQTDYSLSSKFFQTVLPSFQGVIASLDPPPIIVAL
jgi:phage/plasmid primase-like uncharacterized protein